MTAEIIVATWPNQRSSAPVYTGQIESGVEQPTMPSDNPLNREEVDAKISAATAELRGELGISVARIEGSIGALVARLEASDVRNAERAEQLEKRMDKMDEHITSIKSSVWQGVGVVSGIVVAVMFGLVTSFDSGRDTALLVNQAKTSAAAAEASAKDVRAATDELKAALQASAASSRATPTDVQSQPQPAVPSQQGK